MKKLKLKKLLDPSEDFVGSVLLIYASKRVVVAAEGVTQFGVIPCPVCSRIYVMLIAWPVWAFCLMSLKIQIKTVKSNLISIL